MALLSACLLIPAGNCLRRAAPAPGLPADLPARAALTIDLDLLPLRSAVHLSYRRQGIGEVRVRSRAATPLSGLHLLVDLPGREDLLPEPLLFDLPPLEPGAGAAERVRPRFAPAIALEPTSELVFRARVLHRGRVLARSERLVPLIERSAVSWDVPPRVAALVDPVAAARLVRGAPEPPGTVEAVPFRNLRRAAEAFDALRAWGFRYFEDAPCPAAAALLGVPCDRVSLPQETLRDHGGDCDDLTVLLASALEAAGVPSAMGVFEDHVLALFDLGVAAGELEAFGLSAEEVLERGEHAWAPLEATFLARPGSTMLSAWNAARERLPALRSGAARFFAVREAWREFPPLLLRPDLEPGQAAPAALAVGPPRSSGELAAFLAARVSRRAERARAQGGEPGEGERRAAAVFAAAGFREEAGECLRRAVRVSADPALRVELWGLLIAEARDPGDLAAARRELWRALRNLDPLDLAARDEAEKRLALLDRLEGRAPATPDREPAGAPAAAGTEEPLFAALQGKRAGKLGLPVGIEYDR